MSNPWFRMYSEFSHDPKVQMMTEAMQRRYIMIMCLRCSNSLVTLHETEIAFHLRISNEEMVETKALFVAKGFIDSGWNLLNWEKRQFASDTSKARVAKHRALQKEKQINDGNGDVTLQKQNDNALDTEQNRVIGTNVPVAKADAIPAQIVVDVFHEVLPELPKVKLLTDKRKRSIGSFCRFVLTSKKTDGERRAKNKDEAIGWIRSYFERARENDFLMGRVPKVAGHEGWVCDIDYLLSEKGMKQVIEKTVEQAAA